MTEMKLIPYAIVWAVLLIVVIMLAIVRSKMAGQEDDTLKLADGEVTAISTQEQVAKKLATVETVGKWLTVVVVVGGLTLAGLYGWMLFNSSDMFAK
ncbi:MAG: hypothetical protein P4K98_10740 [Bryobacteraceae bacterium]|nr:hypothetical protein [Bryobacteraceae bacterium]